MKIKYQKRDISLIAPLTFMEGNWDFSCFSDPLFVPINWEMLLPKLFQDISIFTYFLCHLASIKKEKSKLEIPPLVQSASPYISTLWKQNLQKFEEFSDLSIKFTQFQKYLQILQRKTQLEQNMHLDVQTNTDRNLSAKLDLKKKLQSEIAKISVQIEQYTQEFQKLTQQYQVQTNQKQNIDNKITELRENQRLLIRETNELTQQMDDLEPQIRVYQEKLTNRSNSEDVSRLQYKLNIVQNQYDQLKKNRQILMAESHRFRQDLQAAQKEQSAFDSTLHRIKPEYEQKQQFTQKLDSQLKSLQNELQQIQSELGDFSESESSPKSIIESPFVMTDISEIQENLVSIQKELQEFFHTSDSQLILQQIQTTQQDLFIQLQQFYKTFGSSTGLQALLNQYQEFLDLITNMVKIINPMLKSLGFYFEISIQIETTPTPQFLFHPHLMHQNREINIDTELKRNEKSWFYFVFLIACYLCVDNQSIALSLEYLPNFMTTRQTFISAMEMLKSSLSTTRLPSSLQIIIYLGKYNYPMSPLILLDSIIS